jgi:hypothetical protein
VEPLHITTEDWASFLSAVAYRDDEIEWLPDDLELPTFATKTTAAGTICFGTCLFNFECSTFHIFAVQSGDCFDGLRIVGHIYESETSRLTRITVSHDMGPFNGSVGFKERTERVLRD